MEILIKDGMLLAARRQWLSHSNNKVFASCMYGAQMGIKYLPPVPRGI